jgi:hypothetical protein
LVVSAVVGFAFAFAFFIGASWEVFPGPGSPSTAGFSRLFRFKPWMA